MLGKDSFEKRKMMMKIGIKYCGGCNPKYDRVAFVDKLRKQCAHCEVKAVNNKETFDCVAVVCGCSVACAGLKDINTRKGFVMVREDNLDATVKHLQTLQCEASESDSKLYV